MCKLSTTLCHGIARQVLASAAPLRARPDGRPALPGRRVPPDGFAWCFGPAAGPLPHLDLHLQPCPPSASTLA